MSSIFGGGLGAFGRRTAPVAPTPTPPSDRRPRLLGQPVDRIPERLPESRRGSRRRITVVGEDVLATPCREVTELGTKELRTLIDDMFATNGVIRPDGRMVHDMFLMQVKSPTESRYPWDYYKLVTTIPGDQAFATKAESKCALWK